MLDIVKLLAIESGELKVKLLPTPVTQDGNGHQQDPAADVGHNGRSVSLSDVVSRLPDGEGPLMLLPTPGASDGNGGKSPKDLSATIRASGAKRQVCLPEAVKLLPTPQAFDYKDLGENVDNILPTPKTHQRGDCPSGRERNSPDLAAVTHHFPVEEQPQAIPVLWGKYEPAVRRWEKLTRPAPIPTEPNKNGNPRLAAPFSEWMMGWPEGWVTDPEIGLPRTAQLKIIGNGVCPQQAYSAITELLSIHASEERMIQ